MIRKAVKADAIYIAEMAAVMWESHSLDELAGEFETVLEDEKSAVYIYCIHNTPVGFAQCGLRHDYVEGTGSSPVGYLEGIFLRDEYRTKGYGRELLAACEKWAEEKGCSEFASDCEMDNDVSFQFHMNLGFIEANRIICFTKRIGGGGM